MTGKLTMLWLALIVATLASALAAHEQMIGFATSSVGAVVLLAVAFLKARFVIMYMMDVHAAPIALKTSMELWCLGMWITLSILRTDLI